MFEDLINSKDNLNEKLFTSKGYIDLMWLKSAVNGNLYPEIKDWKSYQALENTLTYLKPLLEQGKLKVGRYNEGKVIDWNENPDKIISKLRKERENADDDTKLFIIEHLTWFTLPENSWSQIRG